LLSGPDRLKWLLDERGISLETVRRFRLGWIAQNEYYDKPQFGIKSNGKKLCIPSGLLIPWRDERIRIRRDNQGDYSKYYVLSGSKNSPYTIGDSYEKTTVIVESELDAILLSQEIKRQIFIVAMGSAQVKPDEELLKQLELSPVVLIALDNDPAGEKAAQWWTENLGNAFRTMTPIKRGKDITEAQNNGYDLNLWISASLQIYCDQIIRGKNSWDTTKTSAGFQGRFLS
jgi:DNA primase